MKTLLFERLSVGIRIIYAIQDRNNIRLIRLGTLQTTKKIKPFVVEAADIPQTATRAQKDGYERGMEREVWG